MRRPARRRASALGVAAAIVGCGLAGCGGSAPPKPGPTLSAFLSAWGHGDWAAMRAQVTDPPADFRAVNAQAFAALGVHGATFTAGPIETNGGSGAHASATATRASVEVTEHFTLPQVGRWDPTTTVHLVRHRRQWHVTWSPATITPQLHAGETLALNPVWPTRGAILGAGGVPLQHTGERIIIGVAGNRMTDPSTVRADLLAAGATSAQVNAAFAAAKASPQDFEAVFTVSLKRFEALKAAAGSDNVYAVRGTVFKPTSSAVAITQQLAEHVVGTTGPISAAQLKQLGSPYTASSVVGQSGLEASEERTLAGTPTTQINVVDSGGNPITRLATFRGRPGRSVRTSIDPRVQRAAEAALAAAPNHNVAMVAMQASTGRVLAVVSDPLTTYDTALLGAYPPGSTFKVIVSTALFRKGLTPSSPASCPPTINIDGESIHNAGDEAPTPTITQAFIESCNTAFVGLATSHLSPADFPAAANVYGLGGSPHLGVGAFLANVAAPTSRTALAGDSIGQGNITFSTLGMATVAAAIDSGVVHTPTLVQGYPGSGKVLGHLPSSITGGLRPMMLGVVQSGTAQGTGLPAGTHAKTGTAEYGTGPESTQKIDGWLMGYDRNIAFAIVTHDTAGGADGGPVDGPIIARFFHSLGY